MNEAAPKAERKRAGRPRTGEKSMVSAKIPAELVAYIDRLAAQNFRSRSQEIQAILTKALGPVMRRVEAEAEAEAKAVKAKPKKTAAL